MLGVGEGDIGEVDDDAVLRLRLEKCDDLQVVPRNPAASRSGSSRYRTSKKKKKSSTVDAAGETAGPPRWRCSACATRGPPLQPGIREVKPAFELLNMARVPYLDQRGLTEALLSAYEGIAGAFELARTQVALTGEVTRARSPAVQKPQELLPARYKDRRGIFLEMHWGGAEGGGGGVRA